MRKEYYFAFIGPVASDELDDKFPKGEGFLRSALQTAFRTKFGPEKECSSGWGVTDQMRNDASYALISDAYRKRYIKSYKKEGKPLPRALRAWELLFKEENKKVKNKRRKND